MWPFHKFMAVRKGFLLAQARETRAALRARIRQKAKAESDESLLVEEWNDESFERRRED